MQVYLVIWSDGPKGKRMIIGTKRWVNAFWHGAVAANYSAQNQSGQYSLNGGGAKSADCVAEAVREFSEEAGIVDTTPLGFAAELYRVAHKGQDLYAVVGSQVSEAELDTLVGQMQAHVQPDNGDPDRPSGAKVEDWEFESFEIVNVADAAKYLGVPQAIPQTWTVGSKTFLKAVIEAMIKARKAQKNGKYSQDIDWFADIAARLPTMLV